MPERRRKHQAATRLIPCSQTSRVDGIFRSLLRDGRSRTGFGERLIVSGPSQHDTSRCLFPSLLYHHARLEAPRPLSGQGGRLRQVVLKPCTKKAFARREQYSCAPVRAGRMKGSCLEHQCACVSRGQKQSRSACLLFSSSLGFRSPAPAAPDDALRARA